MKTTRDDGFTLIELLIVVAIIGIIAAIAIPGLVRARQSANEASAIGSVRTVNSAEATYAASCGGGGFAQTLTDLALAPPGSNVPFIGPDLATTDPAIKSGYTITLEDGPGANDVLLAASTCNSAAANSRTAFFVHAEPLTIGSTGQRSFASSNTGSIFQLAAGTAIPNTLAGAQMLQ